MRLTVGPGIATPIWLLSVTFYDRRGNVIQTQTNNHLYYTANTLTDSRTMVPDFTGKPLTAQSLVQSAASTTNKVTTTFNYDKFNTRLSSIDQVYNAQAGKRIAAYTYSETG